LSGAPLSAYSANSHLTYAVKQTGIFKGARIRDALSIRKYATANTIHRQIVATRSGRKVTMLLVYEFGMKLKMIGDCTAQLFPIQLSLSVKLLAP
jgi:hypothetical protein